MQTTSRPRENGASFAARRGHLPQLSISDDNHHVTEAIGYMYDDEPDTEPRRASGGNQNRNAIYHDQNAGNPLHVEEAFPPRRTSIPRKQIPERKMSNGNVIMGPSSQMRPPIARGGSWERRQRGSPSPPLSSRDRSGSDTATSPFPLNDIDYESSPAAVAQELSNLQALRRMSMNVDIGAAGDPDLPQLNAAAMPSSPSNSEDDSSRLFWVPARLHPELAPKEFKTFLESKAEQIKRRSGELSQFQSPTSSRSSSLSTPSDSGGLHRKKSMLSRQIHNPIGYQDGADRLERKRSSAHGSPDPKLEELESLVSDTNNRLSMDSAATEENGDIILPSVPGASLKRSTRTNYRRGGSVKGRADRGTYAQRMARKAAGGLDTPTTPSTPDVPPLPTFSEVSNLANTLSFSPQSSEPPPVINRREAHNFSRPALTRVPTPPSQPPTQKLSAPGTFDSIFNQSDQNRFSTASAPEGRLEPMAHTQERPDPSFDKRVVPQIVEVPPPEDRSSQRPSTAPSSAPHVLSPVQHPQRSSSRENKAGPLQRPGMPSKQTSSMGVPPSRTGAVSPPGSLRMHQQPQSLEQPSPLPGNNSGTQELTFIPTLTVDKRADHKKKDEPKKSSWGWLLGKEDDKDKSDKPKAKITKTSQSDNTRLDVLQTSIDGQKGRESLVLDRESLKLEEERKKESARKFSGTESKKEKDSFLSSIFGGKKSKEKEAMKKMRDRLSPEPTYRELKPDIDYNWTRFSILEERAIYRMAHIKLANPRRALYSQVLLSNFMYSYLAKVQQMHPQMNLPTSAKQQRTQQQQKTTMQPDEFSNYQRYQQQQAQQQGQEPPQAQPEPQQQQHQQYAPEQGYEGDTNPHAYDHDPNGHRPTSRGGKHNGDSNGSAYSTGQQYYHQQQGQLNSRDDDDDDDMW